MYLTATIRAEREALYTRHGCTDEQIKARADLAWQRVKARRRQQAAQGGATIIELRTGTGTERRYYGQSPVGGF